MAYQNIQWTFYVKQVTLPNQKQKYLGYDANMLGFISDFQWLYI